MYARLPSIDNISGGKKRQVLQPETCCFCFSMPELPRLNDLIRLANPRADNANRILKSNVPDGGTKQVAHKLKRQTLLILLLVKPSCATDSQMRAWWVRNHQVPTIVEYVNHVALDVWAWAFSRKKVTRHSIKATL
jgi:hypothetical protein